MFKNLVRIATPLALAVVILVISIFSSSQVVYVFGQSSTPAPVIGQKVDVDYQLPFAGKVEPDNFFWPLKALRDKVWIVVSIDQSKKSEVLMLHANKRIVYAKNLMARDKSELSVSTLTKAEKYLEEAAVAEKTARKKGNDTDSLLQNLTMSTLKHRQLLEEILVSAPEDAKPVIVKTIDTNRRIYNDLKVALNSQGLVAPENPFQD